MKNASNEERDRLLAGVVLDDHLETQPDTEQAEPEHTSPAGSSETASSPHAIALRSGPGGTLQFHGPTSIYFDGDHGVSSRAYENPGFLQRDAESRASSAFSILRLASVLGINDSVVQETLPLFFVHQYPQFMFIYREAFLSDYYDNSHGGRYWSYPLLYSMCALGAPHSPDSNVQAKATLLARCAREIVMTHCLTRPSPTTIQALLCLAFHEVGQGNASQGWLFSGMSPSYELAFRVSNYFGDLQEWRSVWAKIWAFTRILPAGSPTTIALSHLKISRYGDEYTGVAMSPINP